VRRSAPALCGASPSSIAFEAGRTDGSRVPKISRSADACPLPRRSSPPARSRASASAFTRVFDGYGRAMASEGGLPCCLTGESVMDGPPRGRFGSIAAEPGTGSLLQCHGTPAPAAIMACRVIALTQLLYQGGAGLRAASDAAASVDGGRHPTKRSCHKVEGSDRLFARHVAAERSWTIRGRDRWLILWSTTTS
jgi:hypothetical protein